MYIPDHFCLPAQKMNLYSSTAIYHIHGPSVLFFLKQYKSAGQQLGPDTNERGEGKQVYGEYIWNKEETEACSIYAMYLQMTRKHTNMPRSAIAD